MPLPSWATPSLAFDLVADLLTREEICELHNIPLEELRSVVRRQDFRALLIDAKKQWDSPTNAEERVRIKARMAQESAIEEMHGIVKSPAANDGDRIGAYKMLMASAEIPGSKSSSVFAAGGGSGLNITINLAGDPRPATIALEPAPKDEDAAALTAE